MKSIHITNFLKKTLRYGGWTSNYTIRVIKFYFYKLSKCKIPKLDNADKKSYTANIFHFKWEKIFFLLEYLISFHHLVEAAPLWCWAHRIWNYLSIIKNTCRWVWKSNKLFNLIKDAEKSERKRFSLSKFHCDFDKKIF